MSIKIIALLVIAQLLVTGISAQSSTDTARNHELQTLKDTLMLSPLQVSQWKMVLHAQDSTITQIDAQQLAGAARTAALTAIHSQYNTAIQLLLTPGQWAAYQGFYQRQRQHFLQLQQGRGVAVKELP